MAKGNTFLTKKEIIVTFPFFLQMNYSNYMVCVCDKCENKEDENEQKLKVIIL